MSRNLDILITRVAKWQWRKDGQPEKDLEPTSVGFDWYDDRTREVVTALVAMGYAIKGPKRSTPAPPGAATPKEDGNV